MKHFLIDKNYGTYLSGMGFSMDEVLKKAMLPEDLFARQTPSLTAEEYFRFMGAIDALSPDEQTLIRLAASEGIEAFSPPIFAAYCSRNESMWEFFEPELKRRLSMMETDDSCAARVRSALMELLPSGECTIDDVAKKLGYSKRSLQRKLQGGRYQLPEAAQPYTGTAGKNLPCQHRYDHRGHCVSAGVSGEWVVPASVHGLDGTDSK